MRTHDRIKDPIASHGPESNYVQSQLRYTALTHQNRRLEAKLISTLEKADFGSRATWHDPRRSTAFQNIACTRSLCSVSPQRLSWDYTSNSLNLTPTPFVTNTESESVTASICLQQALWLANTFVILIFTLCLSESESDHGSRWPWHST